MSRPASTFYPGPAVLSPAPDSGHHPRRPSPRPRVWHSSGLWAAALSIATGLAAAAWAVGAHA